MNRREAAQHKLHFLALLAEKVRAELDSDMAEYQKMEFAELAPDDALRLSQRVCQACGDDWLPDSNFCRNCGAQSKRLQAAQQPTRAAESGELISLKPSIEPALAARMNIAGITAEIFGDGSVVILTPQAVSFTVNRLGSDMLGAYEVKLTPAGASAAPTSMMAQRPPFSAEATR